MWKFKKIIILDYSGFLYFNKKTSQNGNEMFLIRLVTTLERSNQRNIWVAGGVASLKHHQWEWFGSGFVSLYNYRLFYEFYTELSEDLLLDKGKIISVEVILILRVTLQVFFRWCHIYDFRFILDLLLYIESI